MATKYRIIRRRDYSEWKYYVQKQNRRGKWSYAAVTTGFHGGEWETPFDTEEAAIAWIENETAFQNAKDEVVREITR